MARFMLPPALPVRNPVRWWCDSLVINEPDEITQDEYEMLALLNHDLRKDGVESTDMSSHELRAAIRLMRRGILKCTFTLTGDE